MEDSGSGTDHIIAVSAFFKGTIVGVLLRYYGAYRPASSKPVLKRYIV